ncbi:Uncharacterised protein [Klebsiella pneumoniae subsp. ozaenae]|uniref:Uncharacterized protein n=1 Tax=Klebsiella pneumoniae subsp. ozaenae TaxID=574 RepID=A0A378BFT8_KLEPO|nr:Uncharacterised protein [Klebsiella pneumoniae subsp. ozaenae]
MLSLSQYSPAMETSSAAKVGTKYLGVSVATGACQRASSHHAIYMDISVSDKFRTGTHMICNNKNHSVAHKCADRNVPADQSNAFL